MFLGVLALACFLAGATTGAGGAWWVQGVRLDAAKAVHDGYIAQVERNALLAEKAALEQERKWLKEKDDAQREADARLAQSKDDLALAALAAERLRNSLGSLRARLANAAQPALLDAAAALGDVFAACEREYRDVAQAADGHAGDVQTLIAAWPGQGAGLRLPPTALNAVFTGLESR
jgi:hypothetical protein